MKTKLEGLQDQIENHPEKNNEIYATLRLPEIIENLSKEEIKAIEEKRAANFKESLDKIAEGDAKLKENELFYGMSD